MTNLKLNQQYQLGPDIVPWVVKLVYIGENLVVFKNDQGKEESRTIDFFKEWAKEVEEETGLRTR